MLLIILNMFTLYNLQQQRGLEAFLGVEPELHSGPCDKHLPVIPVAEITQEPRDIAYSYRYNPDTGDIEYNFPK